MKITASLLCLISPLSLAAAQTDIHLTEFLAKNETGLLDEDGDLSDWIEIHNGSPDLLDLTGWRLTDDETDPSKWVFPAETLAAGGYLVVFASDKERAIPGAPLHTNFKLSAGGEYLALVRPDGTVATEYAPTYPAQSDDISYGLEPDFVTQAFFDPPTPGAPNVPSLQPLPEVVSSTPHGVIVDSVLVTLSHPEPTAEIRYTLDGREPTEADALYFEELKFESTTTFRARAFAPNALPSPVLSQTWILPSDIFAQSLTTRARSCDADGVDHPERYELDPWRPASGRLVRDGPAHSQRGHGGRGRRRADVDPHRVDPDAP